MQILTEINAKVGRKETGKFLLCHKNLLPFFLQPAALYLSLRRPVFLKPWQVSTLVKCVWEGPWMSSNSCDCISSAGSALSHLLLLLSLLKDKLNTVAPLTPLERDLLRDLSLCLFLVRFCHKTNWSGLGKYNVLDYLVLLLQTWQENASEIYTKPSPQILTKTSQKTPETVERSHGLHTSASLVIALFSIPFLPFPVHTPPPLFIFPFAVCLPW